MTTTEKTVDLSCYKDITVLRARVKFIYLRRKADIVKKYIATGTSKHLMSTRASEAGFSDVDDDLIDGITRFNYWLLYGVGLTEDLLNNKRPRKTRSQWSFVLYARHIGMAQISKGRYSIVK